MENEEAVDCGTIRNRSGVNGTCGSCARSPGLHSLLSELGRSPQGPTTIHQDNQGTIALEKNVVTSRKSKHIDIRHHFVREHISKGDIQLRYYATDNMTADIFTKPLGPIIFLNYRRTLLSGSVEDTTESAMTHNTNDYESVETTDSTMT